MKPLVLDMRNALYGQLSKVSGLVNGFETKCPSAVDDWMKWLKESEALFKKYNLAEEAELAGFRSVIVGESSVHNPSVNSKRRRVFTKAVETVQPVQAICTERFRKLEEKVDTVRNLIRQILVPAKEAGCIKYDASIDFTTYIESILQQFRKHEQLKAGINSAIAMTSKQDVILILAEEIDFE